MMLRGKLSNVCVRKTFGIVIVLWVCTVCLFTKRAIARLEQQQQQYTTESVDWIGKRKNNAYSTLPKDLLESSMSSDRQEQKDPSLHVMKYNIGEGDKESMVYIEPSIESMYQSTPDIPSTSKVTPKFNGFAGKFINLSNKPVSLHWYVFLDTCTVSKKRFIDRKCCNVNGHPKQRPICKY
jgi:hypothetical protein